MIGAMLLMAFAVETLPGTEPLTRTSDLVSDMVAGIDRYLMRETAGSVAPRARRPRSAARLKKILGLVDARVPFDAPELVGTVAKPSLLAKTKAGEVQAVRWPVLNGMTAEGVMVSPAVKTTKNRIIVPDAGQAPEALAVVGGDARVLIPVILDRSDEWSVHPRGLKKTNQPHREFIYRMAFEMGRHPLGYEIQKVLAAVDWFKKDTPSVPVEITGYGEGGLVAMYAAAIDDRIAAVTVVGAFEPRERVWEQPIYRNVWGLLKEFGDAEVAAMIAPRPVKVVASGYPEVSGPPAERDGRRGAAPGGLKKPAAADVEAEVARAKKLGAAIEVVDAPALAASGIEPRDAAGRMKRQFLEMVEFTQAVVRRGEVTRAEFLAQPGLDARKYYHEEVIGKLPAATAPLKAETRLMFDEPGFKGYEAVIPVWQDVDAYGILLVPAGLKPGERRPLVVAQHGLEDRVETLVAPKDARKLQIYAKFAARLAERGFIVWVHQNPYIFQDRFRVLNRKANPLGLSMYSFIIGQQARALDWLETLPFVDKDRMAFYGLSYGGKTAMRVPPVEPRYKAVICSGDFNEWIWKITSYDAPFSYMYTGEYELQEFDLGGTFGYAELAGLITPRPFMVERGHRDGVGIDEWISYEYAKVRRAYADVHLAERTEMEFFEGPHQIWGDGTFRFLHRWLGWP